MEKEKINQLLGQIIGGANSVFLCGEENMAQLVGICRAARQIHQLVNTPEKGEDDG